MNREEFRKDQEANARAYEFTQEFLKKKKSETEKLYGTHYDVTVPVPVPAKTEAAVYGAVNEDIWGQKRIGDWIQTRTGIKFHLLDPRPEDFVIEDIAHALANQCRFTGHVKEFYSVAEHSVRVAELVASRCHAITPLKTGFTSTQLIYAALMHDASEGYITDIARPFKQLPEFAFYREIEDKLMEHIAARFQFQYPLHRMIKDADEVLLGTEARDLMAPVVHDWHLRYQNLDRKIRPWSPRKAKRRFLKMYYELNPLGARAKPSLLARILSRSST